MDRISQHLAAVPLPLLAAATVAGLVAFALIPAHRRLYVCIGLVVPWMTVARFPDLGVVASAAKATSVVPLALVAVAAWRHPGDRLRPPRFVSAYCWLAATSIVFVAGTAEGAAAVLLQAQWLGLTVACYLTMHVVTSRQDVERVMHAVAAGCAAGILLVMVAWVTDPHVMLHNMSFFRLSPWGVNPNQIAPLFIVSVPFLLYAAATRHPLRVPALVLAGLAAGLTFLTASRAAVVIVVLMVPVLIATTAKRPKQAVTAICVAGVLAVGIVGSASEVDFGRMVEQGLYSGRGEIASYYLDEHVAERPLTGLLLTRGQGVDMATGYDQYTHNGYLQWLYVGGALLALPMFLLAIGSLLSVTWMYRTDPVLWATVGVWLVAVYLSGFTHGILYVATDGFAFVHVLMAMMALTLAKQPERAKWSCDLCRARLVGRTAPAPGQARVGADAPPRPPPSRG